MIRTIFLVLMALNFHGALAAETMAVGSLPASTQSPAPAPQIVGSMPYSNQWKFEELGSFLYITLNSQQLTRADLTVGQYLSSFGNSDLYYPSIDYFVRMFRLADPESSALGEFGFWTRYGLGLTVKHGTLSSKALSLADESSSSYLAIGVARLGPVLQYEGWRWVNPYAGAQFFFSAYRHSSSVSGAEAQGAGAGFEPVAGLHFPVLFEHRISAYAEAKLTRGLSSNLLIADGIGFDGGLGLTF